MRKLACYSCGARSNPDSACPACGEPDLLGRERRNASRIHHGSTQRRGDDLTNLSGSAAFKFSFTPEQVDDEVNLH